MPESVLPVSLTRCVTINIPQGHTQSVTGVVVTTDGLKAVSGSYDDTIKIWDLAAGECLRTLAVWGAVWGIVSIPGRGFDSSPTSSGAH